MTLKQALDQRIPRIRKPQWANPRAYLRLPLFPDGTVGPWAELYDEEVQAEILHVRPGSQRLLAFDPDDGYEVYSGPVSAWEQDKQNFASSYAEE